jgi:hypothetical protein
MNQPFLPPDDLPPVQITQLDKILRRQLEESTSKRFYEVCGRITKVLLSSCQWYVTTNASALTLVITCPDVITYWNIVSDIEQIGNRLERFSSSAKICVCPPIEKGAPFEISVDEISTYRDFF